MVGKGRWTLNSPAKIKSLVLRAGMLFDASSGKRRSEARVQRPVLGYGLFYVSSDCTLMLTVFFHNFQVHKQMSASGLLRNVYSGWLYWKFINVTFRRLHFTGDKCNLHSAVIITHCHMKDRADKIYGFQVPQQPWHRSTAELNIFALLH